MEPTKPQPVAVSKPEKQQKQPAEKCDSVWQEKPYEPDENCHGTIRHGCQWPASHIGFHGCRGGLIWDDQGELYTDLMEDGLNPLTPAQEKLTVFIHMLQKFSKNNPAAIPVVCVLTTKERNITEFHTVAVVPPETIERMFKVMLDGGGPVETQIVKPS